MRIVVLVLLAVFLLADTPRPALATDVVGTVSIKSSVAPRALGKHKAAPARDDGGSGYGYGSEEDEPPPHRLSKDEEARFVVVYLEPTVGRLQATPSVATMRQNHKEFVPHVLPVVRGSHVVFSNDDHILHNIYSVTAPGFEIPKYSHGGSQRIPMTLAGPVEVFCAIHSRMNGYVFVVDNDFFTMPGAGRRYALHGVPPGTYLLKAWHPRTHPFSTRITVPAAGSVNVDVTL